MKKTYLWFLYDFANSFASIVLIFYYPLILSERGVSDTWIGVSASLSTCILLFFLPRLGHIADKKNTSIIFIRIGSIVMAISLFFIAYITSYLQYENLLVLTVLSAIYIVFQLSFQGSYSFYLALLRTVSKEDTNVKVAGIGNALGQFGNVLGLIVATIVLGTGFTLFSFSGKPLTILIGGLIFLIIAYPFLKQTLPNIVSEKTNFSYLTFLNKVYKQKKIFYFLVGYSLLADAILTFQIYLTIYIKKVFGFSDQMATYAGICALLFSILAGVLSHHFVIFWKDRYKALIVGAIFYTVAFIAMSLVPPSTALVFLALSFSGLSYGFFFSIARSVYSQIIPEKEQGEYFGIYTVFERAASVVGPLLWIITFKSVYSFGEDVQYRFSVMVLAALCLFGILFLARSKKK